MTRPIDLAAKRAQRDAEGVTSVYMRDGTTTNIACERCGSEWWTAHVVIAAETMLVAGHSLEGLLCAECGEEWSA